MVLEEHGAHSDKEGMGGRTRGQWMFEDPWQQLEPHPCSRDGGGLP